MGVEKITDKTYSQEEFEIVKVEEGEREGVEPGEYVASKIKDEDLESDPIRSHALSASVALQLNRGVGLGRTNLRTRDGCVIYRLEKLGKK